MAGIGTLDLPPPKRWVRRLGGYYLMGNFTRVTPDRPNRLTNSGYGVLCADKMFETALLKAIRRQAWAHDPRRRARPMDHAVTPPRV